MKADGWDRQGASEVCQSAGLAPSCLLPVCRMAGSQRLPPLFFPDGAGQSDHAGSSGSN
jgi:hypothetical protein